MKPQMPAENEALRYQHISQRKDLQEVCGECHWWTGARHHEYGICRVTTNKCSRLHPCDCKRFRRE